MDAGAPSCVVFLTRWSLKHLPQLSLQGNCFLANIHEITYMVNIHEITTTLIGL